MKVLISHCYYQQRGGEDLSFEQEGDLLESHGHQVIRFVIHNDELERMNPLRAAAKALWNRQMCRKLRHTIRRERPDVVHFTNTFPLLSPGVLATASREGVAVVQAVRNYRMICANAQLMRDGNVCEQCVGHSSIAALRHGCYRNSRAATAVVVATNMLHCAIQTHRHVDRFYTPSAFARSKLIEAGFPAERILVKPNFVPLVQVQPADARRGAIFVGRLSAEKGIHCLLAAWKRVAISQPLTIVGDGPLAADVEVAAQQDPRIRFLGSQSPERVLELIGEASLLVMPSVWYETFGRTIIESFAMATPVLASRLGAMAELVDHERTGRLFRAADANDLASQLEAMLSDPDACARMGVAAKSEYETLYTPRRNYEILLNIYQQALEHHTAQTGRQCTSTAIPSACGRPGWPNKHDVLGVQVSATNYNEAVECITRAAEQRQSAIVSLHAVHAVVTCGGDRDLRRMVNTFDLIGPDGQPVRWALNLLHRVGLKQRVYGPELMLRVCARAATDQIPVFFYGGTSDVLSALIERLREKYPGLLVAGRYAPPFRPLTAQEDEQLVELIRASGARVLFIGLGAPKQDRFAFEHRDRLDVVQICVGAAFDFHAEVKAMAPRWMQDRGLEWLFRLIQEPRRLARRYFVTNTIFISKLSFALVKHFGASVLDTSSLVVPLNSER